MAAHMPCNGSWQACGSKIQMLKILKVQTGDLFPRHFLCVQCASVHYVYVCVCVCYIDLSMTLWPGISYKKIQSVYNREKERKTERKRL